MSLSALDKMVRIGQLKAEPRNIAEVRRMLSMARTMRLTPSQIESIRHAAQSVLGPQVFIKLFESRARNDLKGGE